MSNSDLIVARLWKIVETLATQSDSDLSQALQAAVDAAGGAVDEPTLAATALVDRIRAEAKSLWDRAAAEVAVLEDRAEQARADLEATKQRLADEANALIAQKEQAVALARRKGDQQVAAARAAKVPVDDIEEAAASAVAAAAAEVADAQQRAQQAIEQGTAAPQALVDDLKSEITTYTDQLETAQKEIDRLTNEVTRNQAILEMAEKMAQGVLGDIGLPQGVIALGLDVRSHLTGISLDKVSLTGVITMALVHLKETVFQEIDTIQVVAITPDQIQLPDMPSGIGFSWQDAAKSLHVAFVPGPPSTVGNIVVHASGNDVNFAEGPLSLRLTGADTNQVTIPLDSSAPPGGDFDVTLTASLDTTPYRWDDRDFGMASLGTPSLMMHVRSVGDVRSYRVVLSLQDLTWKVQFGFLPGILGSVLPLPELGERRSYDFVIEDGVFAWREAIGVA